MEMKPVKEGKVREIYDNGDSLIMVATDRISCYDVILKNQIVKKGTVLTQMSRFWFDMTQDILPNHMITTDVNEMPEFFRQPQFDGNSMMCRKLTMLPVECIVRGYITGSGWASYQKNGTVCGITLPEGLVESDKLPEPIYTPSTKAEIGDHDENISFEQSVDVLEKEFPGKGREYAEKLRDYTIALYRKCADYALTKGIIIADTKFEFGLDENGEIVLGDEMLTPDSSRFWPAEGYEPGHGQPSFDKQFARDWLKSDENKEKPETGEEDSKESSADKGAIALDVMPQIFSSRMMDQAILNRLGINEQPEPEEKEPVIGMDGTTEDGAVPYQILMKQLDFLK
jgi:phosphoribosylaminoimidazole-succinocarboxamide synthase